MTEVNKTRAVEPLRDIDEQGYVDALKDKTIDTYENEIAIMGGALSIPDEIMSLPIQAQQILAFYLDKDWVNGQSGRKSYRDVVESYIASLTDTDFLDDLYMDETRIGQNGEPYMVKVVNPNEKHLYMKLKQYALSYWNNHKLSQYVNVWKKLLKGGVKDEDSLKDAIIDDALYHSDDNYRLRSRNQAIKVLGMDKNAEQGFHNVWVRGGQDMAKHLAQYTGKSHLDNSKFVEASVDEQEEE